MMGDRTVNITGEQIAQKLNEKLALPISLLKVFDVNLSNSQVTGVQTCALPILVAQLDKKLIKNKVINISFVFIF